MPTATKRPNKLISAESIPAPLASTRSGAGIVVGPAVEGLVLLAKDKYVGVLIPVLVNDTSTPVIVVNIPSTFASNVVLLCRCAVVVLLVFLLVFVGVGSSPSPGGDSGSSLSDGSA